MSIHILPTPKALDNLFEIEQETGLIISAGGELVKRKPSPLMLEMYEMQKAMMFLNRSPFKDLK